MPPTMWGRVRRVEIVGTVFTICVELLHIGRMGRFSSALLLLLAACGDNFDDDGVLAPPADDIEPGDTATATPRYVPTVCGVQTWTTKLANNDTMNISVSQRPNGAVALAVPREGGALTGFVLDTRAQTLTGSKVAIAETASEVATSYLVNRVVAVAAHDDSVYVNLLDNDFTNPELTTKVWGRVLAEGAFVSMQQDLILPVGADDGVWLHRFDDSLEPHGSTLLLATAPVRSMAAAQLGDATLTAWATDDDCYLAQTSTFGPGISTSMPRACQDPRLAVNPTTKQALMLFDTEEGVQMVDAQTMWGGGPARPLRAGTHAPRAVFDGTNFWVSYLDVRGDVLVGFLDGKGNPITMALEGTRPEATAYELVMIDGAPWVFSLASEGYTAHRMCIDTLW